MSSEVALVVLAIPMGSSEWRRVWRTVWRTTPQVKVLGKCQRSHVQSNCTDILCKCYISAVGSRKSSQTELPRTLAVEVRAVYRKLKQRIREHGAGTELTPSQTSVLLRLEKDGSATVSSLARAEGMRPQSMSAIVNPLQKSGLVNGVTDQNDGRQTLMSLTPKCRKWLEASRAARQDWLAALISERLSAEDQELLQTALGLLARLTEN